jgi:hypothetical protein
MRREDPLGTHEHTEELAFSLKFLESCHWQAGGVRIRESWRRRRR